METTPKDQPIPLLYRVLTVAFGPFDAPEIRRHAYLRAGDSTKLFALLVLQLFIPQRGQSLEQVFAPANLVLNLLVIALYLSFLTYSARSIAVEEAARYQAGLLLLMVGCLYASMPLLIFLAPPASAVMMAFVILWIVLRVRLIMRAGT